MGQRHSALSKVLARVDVGLGLKSAYPLSPVVIRASGRFRFQTAAASAVKAIPSQQDITKRSAPERGT